MPDAVLNAMHRAAPNIYSGALIDMMPALMADLRRVARTKHHVAMYVGNGHAAWEAALSNVSGVYLLTDRKTGKLFVGSAHGGDTIWHQWVSFAINGHADVKPLRQLLSREVGDYQFNFQFAILEVCDLSSTKDYVLSRSEHWKNVLHAVAFGYNTK